jgi:hypothetical protein
MLRMSEENVEKNEQTAAGETGEQTEAVKQEASTNTQETVSATQKKKKISQMTLEEIETRIKTVQEKMGGLGSQYAQQLLKQKQVLGG